MGLGTYLLHQFAQPHGKLGGFFAGMMNRGNAAINGHALEALQVQEGNRVLEIGFGGGAALESLLQGGAVSFVAGLDPSLTAVRRATARLRGWIDAGRLEVQLGSVESIPWSAASFDRLLSVNSIYYWPDPARGAREMYRVLRPGGMAVIALRAKAVIDKLGLEKHGYRSLGEQEVGALLAQAGFSSVGWQTREDEIRGGVVLVVAQKQLDLAL